MGAWIVVLVAAALVAGPVLFIWARRACVRRAAEDIGRIYATAERETLALGPSTPRVTFKYHTYSGLLIHSGETEHFLELPRPVAESTLDALLRHNLTYGFLAEVLLGPVLAYVNYRAQKRSIRKQAESPGGERIATTPRPGESGLQRWGGAFLVLFMVFGACVLGVREVRETLANRAPLAMACHDFVEQPPANRWVRLTGASGALQDSAVRFRKSVPDRVYVPLTCGDSPAGPIRMVLATEDGSLVRTISMRAPTEAWDHTVILAVTTKPSLRVERDIQGMVRGPKDHETETTIGGGLEAGGCIYCPVKIQRLAADYVVIEEGAAPSLLRGLAWLAAAAAGTVYVWKGSHSRGSP